MMPKTLAIVGAGAKAAAIVARAAVLKDVGRASSVPRIHVFEREHAGAAWSGHGDFSSGFLRLCTPGEKDVGFPYSDTVSERGHRAAIAPRLFARFSWGAYLTATGRMADWIDRGRDHPLHRQWAEYLEWVFNQARQSITPGNVTAISRRRGKWEVTSEHDGVTSTTRVDGVVLTGTGAARKLTVGANVPEGHVFDSETFWKERERVAALREGTIAVAGDGGSAGTVVAWLAERLAETDIAIASISPMGTLFPRGDGFAERRWFSDPTEWPDLTDEHRRKLLAHTEAGVISARIKRVTDLSHNVHYLRGRAIGVRWDDDEDELVVDIDYEGDPTPQHANFLINAFGFNSWSTLALVRDPHVARLIHPDSEKHREEVEAALRDDLSLPPILGLPSGIHLPAIGGYAHGPGMGNLGCLGLMAAAVLAPYLK